MKYLSLLLVLILLTGCGKLKLMTPYGHIEQGSDSQLFIYTDADVKITSTGVVSDDTTLIVLGIKTTGQDLTEIFNHAMTKVEEIFKTRGKIYRSWTNKSENKNY